jgi:NifU-like protein
MAMMQHATDRFGEHFANPKNVGVLVEANAVGSVGALDYGDAVKLMLRIDPATDRIEQARFQTYGCSSAIAASSAITEMIIGKSLDEALEISSADIAEFLGGLPDERMYCSVMTYEAVQKAVAAYRHPDEAAIKLAPLCKCFGVSEAMAERTIRINHLTDPHQVTFHTKAGGGCVGCYKQIETVLSRVNAEMVASGDLGATQAYRPGSVQPNGLELRPSGAAPPTIASMRAAGVPSHIKIPPRPAPVAPTAMSRSKMPPPESRDRGTPEQYAQIEQAVQGVRPNLQRDGGDCELIDVDGNTIYLKLSGNCLDCQLASVTLSGIQAQITEKMKRLFRVVPVS